MSQLQTSRFSATVWFGKMPFAAGDLDHAHRHPDLRIGERDGAAVHAHDAAVGDARAR